MIHSEKLLTVEQAAEQLSVKPATIRRWILLRRIAYCKVGRSVRIQAGELARIVTVIPPRPEAR